jgi:hypothetical protein
MALSVSWLKVILFFSASVKPSLVRGMAVRDID